MTERPAGAVMSASLGGFSGAGRNRIAKPDSSRHYQPLLRASAVRAQVPKPQTHVRRCGNRRRKPSHLSGAGGSLVYI